MKPKRTLCLSAAGLVLSAVLAIPCWSAEVVGTQPVKPAGSKQAAPVVQKAAPRTPIVRPGSMPSPSMTGQIQGKLSALGGKVTLRLTRSVTRVDVFAGRRKLGTLGAGTTFDVTNYLPQADATGLVFNYFGSDGRKSTQVVAPGEIQALSGKSARKNQVPGTPPPPPPPPPPGPPGVAKGGSSSADPRLSSQVLSPSMSQSGVKKDVTSPQRVGTKISNASGSIRSTGLSSMTITSPVLGDFMVEAGQFVLQWSGFGNIPEKCVNIDLVRKYTSGGGRIGEETTTIARNICVNGFNWRLLPGMSGTGYKIRIETIDNAFTDDSDTFSILAVLPDLIVTNLHIQPANADLRDDITVTGVIQNSGHGTSDSTIFRVSNGNELRYVNLPSLAFGPGAQYPFSETFGPSLPGVTNRIITVEVDPQGVVSEADENNNIKQISFALVALPNLISGLTDEVRTDMWKRTEIQFWVKNISSEPVAASVCRTWISKKGHETHNIPPLGSLETYAFHRSVTFVLAGWRDYSINADYGDTVRESHEDDNATTGRIHAKSVLKALGF